MAHPDPHRAGSERDQRRHVGNTGEASDAGIKDTSQGEPGVRSLERASDDVHQAPESGEKPEVMPAGGSGSAATDDQPDLLAIYQALKRNAGRERVTDANVAALIEMAQRNGDAQLEYLLREWRSGCGDDADAPPLEQVQGLPGR